MIEKLIIYRILANEYENEGYEYPTTEEIVEKINEIIDYINNKENENGKEE